MGTHSNCANVYECMTSFDQHSIIMVYLGSHMYMIKIIISTGMICEFIIIQQDGYTLLNIIQYILYSFLYLPFIHDTGEDS